MKSRKFMVYANGVLVDNVVAPWEYTAEDYREDCFAGGWESAPCNKTDHIEVVEVKEEKV